MTFRSNYVVMKYREAYSRIWTPLFNLIMSKMRVPSRWICEKITVIPKQPDPPTLKKLRNISILPYNDKLFEKLIKNIIMSEANFDQDQFGFQPNSSIDDAIPAVREEALGHLDKSPENLSIIGSADIKAAFNSVSHAAIPKGITKQVNNHRIAGVVQHYLQDRTLIIKHRDLQSRPMKVTSDCPQGSACGLIFYNLAFQLIRMDFRNLPKISMYRFADDSTFLLQTNKAECRDDLGQSQLSNALAQFESKDAQIGLRVHPKKCNSSSWMGGRRSDGITFTHSGQEIERVKEALELHY